MSNNSSMIQNQYNPDHVSPPGETLLEKIQELGMRQTELAQRTGRTKKTINEIVQGKAPITPETALQFERVLHISAAFWNNRERQYRQYLARMEEDARLARQVDWLKKFPIKAMIQQAWIREHDDAVQQVRELLSFFGVASPEQWEVFWGESAVAYRKTPAFQSNSEAVSAWLRMGEIKAQHIRCQPYKTSDFRKALINARRLTLEPPEVFQSKLVNLCAGVGVAVVFVRQLPRARVSGATRWLNPDKALIQLSLRYRTDDHLWFTFFHEAGHILFHGKRDVFLEVEDTTDVKEEKANNFASNILIPPDRLKSFLRRVTPNYISIREIRTFASEIGIAPGIVVGRLQHDGLLSYKNCNGLKQKFVWLE